MLHKICILVLYLMGCVGLINVNKHIQFSYLGGVSTSQVNDSLIPFIQMQLYDNITNIIYILMLVGFISLVWKMFLKEYIKPIKE